MRYWQMDGSDTKADGNEGEKFFQLLDSSMVSCTRLGVYHLLLYSSE